MPPSTPVKSKYSLSSNTHRSATHTRNNTVASAQFFRVNEFERRYLRNETVKMPSDWPTMKQDIMSQLANRKTESVMYPLICRLLTEISLAVSGSTEDSGSCLVFRAIANIPSQGKFEGSKMRPDIACVMSTRKEAVGIARTGKHDDPVHWNELVSLCEVKKASTGDVHVQAGSYLYVLPRCRPDLAGMLYMSWENQHFHLYWSDTSGIIRSPSYPFSKARSWKILFLYVRTIWDPLPSFPTRDPTMSLSMGRSLTPKWKIQTKQRMFIAELFFSTSAHGRQTCVFLDEVAKRVIKDHWRDTHRRFRESIILQMIKGVPGVVQVDFSEVITVEIEGAEVPLRTNEMHSGPNALKERDGSTRSAPHREKQRSVLKTTGDGLDKRTTVRQLLMALYDGIEGHGLCLGKKRVLHRDVSQNNIIINPVHHDTKLDDYPDAKFINQVLDPSITEIKEEGALIDWDNAANLNELTEANPLTNRTGTPMFVACAVANGRVARNLDERPEFPEISDRARELYSKAYGSEKYELYRNAINNAPALQRESPRARIVVEHCGHHDIESFFWVLVFQLLHAWPEGEEDLVTDRANEMMQTFENHNFKEGGADIRASILFNIEEDQWCEVLHPGLKKLAGMLAGLTFYMKTEWLLWKACGLPEDHCHEAMKCLLLDGILLLDDDPIALRLETRKMHKPTDNPFVQMVTTVQESESLGKRSRDEAEEDEDEVLPARKHSKLSEGSTRSRALTSTAQKGRSSSSKVLAIKRISRGQSGSRSNTMPPPSYIPSKTRQTRNSANTPHGQSAAPGGSSSNGQTNPEA
ncbi:hypothetical protein M0805_002681 [Coniferiporia weirii]|nr:hypothetical protein M0805_002681 [Coniferiporia weirii]